jgi:cyclohexyl-isocyanide hydratase
MDNVNDLGRMIELIIEYNPAPPYGTGHPSIADPEILKRAQAMLAAAFG